MRQSSENTEFLKTQYSDIQETHHKHILKYTEQLQDQNEQIDALQQQNRLLQDGVKNYDQLLAQMEVPPPFVMDYRRRGHAFHAGRGRG